MKKIEAIIKPEHLEPVKDALKDAGFVGLTVTNVRGRGAQGGIQLEWRAGTYRVDLLHKVMLMMVTKDDEYRRAVDIIVEVCRADATGGAGKIFISPVDEVIRIRTGETDHEAL